MIYIGQKPSDKEVLIQDYTNQHNIKSVVFVRGFLDHVSENEYPFRRVIEYKYFYKILQTVDVNTLIVIDECMRTQNRYELAYNCIRQFLTQTSHKLIFQQLPFIDNEDDFMILFDFETASKWKRDKFDYGLISAADINISPFTVDFNMIEVMVSDDLKEVYRAKRNELFDGLGARDPHIIPRNLQLVSTKEKKCHIWPVHNYVSRSKRFNLNNVSTYNEAKSGVDYKILDLPHRFIDFSDFLYVTWQSSFDVLVADLKVEEWYFQRYVDWAGRLNEFYSNV